MANLQKLLEKQQESKKKLKIKLKVSEHTVSKMGE